MNFPIALCWFLFVCGNFFFVIGAFGFCGFGFLFVCLFLMHKPWIVKIHGLILIMGPSCQMDWNNFALLADLRVVELHCHLDIFTVYMFWTYLELIYGHTKLEWCYKIDFYNAWNRTLQYRSVQCLKFS